MTVVLPAEWAPQSAVQLTWPRPEGDFAKSFDAVEATFVTLAALNAICFALAADYLRMRIRRPNVLRWVNRAGASCLVAMGAATAAVWRS